MYVMANCVYCGIEYLYINDHVQLHGYSQSIDQL